MTIVEAKRALFNLFARSSTGEPVAELARVQRVYLGEPRPGEAQAPISMAVSVSGGNGLEFTCVVNVYASPDVDATAVQGWLDETNDAVCDILADSATFGRGTFTTQYLGAVDVFVTSHQVTVGREDF